MTVAEVITLVESGLRLGQSAVDITQRLCSEHGGQQLPTLSEFEARVDALRQTPDLTTAQTTKI